MSKNVLVGVNGLAREAENLWVGVDGKARKVKSAYVGVNGVARKFWPKIVYVWNRYGISYKLTESAQIRYMDSRGNFYYSYIQRNPSYNRAYIYSTSNTNTAANWPFEITSRGSSFWTGDSTYISINAYFSVSPTLYEAGERPSSLVWYTTRCSNPNYVRSVLEFDSIYPDSTNHIYIDLDNENGATLYKIGRQASQGSYVGQVTSENPNMYPQNGQSGSYWYVYQGTQG